MRDGLNSFVSKSSSLGKAKSEFGHIAGVRSADYGTAMEAVQGCWTSLTRHTSRDIKLR
jgi:hypothetical protein